MFKTFEFKNGGLVAEKIIKLRPDLNSSEIAAFKREVSRIVKLGHQNLVEYLAVDVTPFVCKITTMYNPKCSLKDLFPEPNVFEEY